MFDGAEPTRRRGAVDPVTIAYVALCGVRRPCLRHGRPATCQSTRARISRPWVVKSKEPSGTGESGSAIATRSIPWPGRCRSPLSSSCCASLFRWRLRGGCARPRAGSGRQRGRMDRGLVMGERGDAVLSEREQLNAGVTVRRVAEMWPRPTSDAVATHAERRGHLRCGCPGVPDLADHNAERAERSRWQLGREASPWRGQYSSTAG